MSVAPESTPPLKFVRRNGPENKSDNEAFHAESALHVTAAPPSALTIKAEFDSIVRSTEHLCIDFAISYGSVLTLSEDKALAGVSTGLAVLFNVASSLKGISTLTK
jgi:hypothetical protein